MRVIDAVEEKNYIVSSIKANGSMPEHNYHYLLHNSSNLYKSVFIGSGNKQGVLAIKGKTIWKFISEPVAPENKKVSILVDAINIAMKSGAKKIILELTDETRNGILTKLPANCIARKPVYIYYWPVYDLKKFDPEFHGTGWKKMRNIKNYFEKNHEIKLVDTHSVEKGKLMEIFRKWSSKRAGFDRVEKDRCVNAIEEGFDGYEIIKTLLVDGEPCTISGGWKMPNSNNFYSSLGLLNYEHKYLGEFAIIAELTMLKKMGFSHVNFGGSGEYLLRFKTKFRPERIYKTTEFSVAKK
ncbi:hypothetical protein HYZ41_00565 [archaeon]|nr:hypothetical protein [archaeon]